MAPRDPGQRPRSAPGPRRPPEPPREPAADPVRGQGHARANFAVHAAPPDHGAPHYAALYQRLAHQRLLPDYGSRTPRRLDEERVERFAAERQGWRPAANGG